MSVLRFAADEDADGQRLDKAASAALSALSRTAVQELIRRGAVYVDGVPRLDKNFILACGMEVVLDVPAPREMKAEPQDIPLDIVYEDDWLLVVDKPKGMVVHPAPGNPDGTLVNALLWHCGDSLSGIGGVLRPGIVHRIDKDTSGLLVVAKNDAAHISLSRQIGEHSFTREYRAVAQGRFREPDFTVDAPIGRSTADRKKMCVTEKNSRRAVTHFQVLEEAGGCSDLRCTLETGRTHQIRVHLAYLGHPVVGDTVYGPKKPLYDTAGQCLHAAKIGFLHPKTGEYMEFESPLPPYFTGLLQKLRAQ